MICVNFTNYFKEAGATWQLEELIAKAIRSDFNKSERVVWKGNGHDIGCDILVNDNVEIQIKSGAVDSKYLTLSGHRLGRFKGNLQEITNFLNQNLYLLIAVPYYDKDCELGKSHIYQIFYLDTKMLKLNDYAKWNEKKGKKGGVSYYATNDFGVELSIHPTMSWQIWWNVPLNILTEENKTRLIIIN
ncbi:MAG: hypothetical protein LW595_01450 [Rickettsiales bacterium]|nr:hypothetical protein [Rickettsiales bacterium]